MSRLQNKVAVITGGTSGMGLAAAQRFVAEGAFVYIFARRQKELDKAVGAIGRNIAGVQGDVSKLEDLDRLYAKVSEEKGKFDILFAGAGIVDPQSLAETTEESFDKVFAINTRGVAFTVKKALPLLKDGGAIIVVTSIAEGKDFWRPTAEAVGDFLTQSEPVRSLPQKNQRWVGQSPSNRATALFDPVPTSAGDDVSSNAP